MSTKYIGLPDIDSAPDVFETPDEPETTLRPTDFDANEDAPRREVSENIDQSGLPDRQAAGRMFRRRKREDTYRPGRIRSASSSSDTPSKPIRETTAVRLKRLQAELSELEKDIAQKSSDPPAENHSDEEQKEKRKSVLPPRPIKDLVGEMGKLRERLGSLENHLQDNVGMRLRSGEEDGWRDRFESLKIVTLPEKEGKGLDGKDRTHEIPMSNLSNLDERLALLENAIGLSTEVADHNPTPLLTTMTKLDHLLLLLTNPRNLDAISRRVKLLLVDLDRAAAASRRAPPTTTTTYKPDLPSLTQTEYQSLLSLFSLLPRLDPLLPILPPLLIRLRSLSTLHDEAGSIADKLNSLRETERIGMEETKELRDAVKNVQESTTRSTEQVEKNWNGLDGRLKELEKRLWDLKNG
ncbi:hypothetical protein M231_00772 [Tremella mesenterica]|uniref:Dynactin 2 n=1 Tax=Tremella mesenterica TaxID=5217 RepID=A0A4Q1BVD8_TREME|nr:hypothetical protein M231_00772 [Tremella mesenterica]